MIPPALPLLLASSLFAVGLAGLLLRRNLLVMLMCVEVMVGAGTLGLLAFAPRLGMVRAQGLALFVLGVGAAELAVALAVVAAWNRQRGGADIETATALGDLESPAAGEED